VKLPSRAVLLVSVCGLVAALPAFAGPPEPPAGPIAPTMKPLDQVEPRTTINATNTPGDADSVFRITQPGSYYLAANLSGESGKAGIEIAASNVTIDLMGFTLQGVPGSLDGVRTSVPSPINLVTTTGSVQAWAGDGIDLATETAASCRIEGIAAGLNGRTGILLGRSAAVARCTARANNTSNAFNMAGINAGPGSTISDCTAELNNGHGIAGNAGSTVTDCAAHSNTGDGVRVGNGSTVTACSAHSNGRSGVAAPAGWNSPPFGVVNGDGSTISGCTVMGNVFAGVQVNAGCTISGCTARNNGAGIVCSSRTVIRDNTCSNNTGSGIVAGDTLNVIDGNTCADNAKGIEVTFAGTLIIRNTCSGNDTNWSIAPNNRMGPIVLCNVNPAPVNGSSAPGTLNTTDPHANFTY
jgi:parallel beta-helix repeat protein